MNNEMLPNNIEAEEAVLGSLLIDPDAILFTVDVLRHSDFFIQRHEWIYETICELHKENKPADIVAIADELQNKNRDVQAHYLTGLINATPSSMHVEHYAKIVKDASIKRQLISAAGEVAKISFNGTSADEAISQSMAAIMDVSTANITDKPRLPGDFTGQILDEVTAMAEGQREPGLSVGLKDVDKLIGGLKRSKLYILAGRPGMGKSSLALQAAIEAAEVDKQVLYFSEEMPGVELVTRMVSYKSGIDGQRLQNGELAADEWERFYKALEYVQTLPIYIDDRTRTVEGIRAKATLQSARGIDLLIVDYIQRVQTGVKYQNRDSEVGAVGSALKTMAIDLRVPVIAISSLNRQCENRADKRPMLADLRESGNLEYDADVVVFIYRDEIYNANTEFPNVAEITLAKHRGGRLGAAHCYFRKQNTQFIDLEVRQVRLNE